MPIIRNAVINGIPLTAAHTRIDKLSGNKTVGFSAGLSTYASTEAYQSGLAPICPQEMVDVAYVPGQDIYNTIYVWAEANLYAGQVVS